MGDILKRNMFTKVAKEQVCMKVDTFFEYDFESVIIPINFRNITWMKLVHF